jgi:hypothetical protein
MVRHKFVDSLLVYLMILFSCVGYVASNDRVIVNYELDGRGHDMI